MLKLGVSVKQLVVASLLVALFLPFGHGPGHKPAAALAYLAPAPELGQIAVVLEDVGTRAGVHLSANLAYGSCW